jgi:hypothetical protein
MQSFRLSTPQEDDPSVCNRRIDGEMLRVICTSVAADRISETHFPVQVGNCKQNKAKESVQPLEG